MTEPPSSLGKTTDEGAVWIDYDGEMLWWLSFALAGPVEIGGKTSGHSLILLGEGSGRLLASACNDAGLPPDQAADGRWTCAPLEEPVERVGVLKDGRLESVSCPDVSVLLLGDRGLSCGGTLPAAMTGVAVGPAPQVLVHLRAESTGGTPVLALEGTGGRVELSCRNDGHFPDDRRNDDQFGCAGASPGDTVKIVLNGGNGQRKELGEAHWSTDTFLRYLSVDASGGTPSTEPFLVVLQGEAAPTAAPGPAEGQPPPAAPGAPMESPPAAPYRLPALLMTGVIGLIGGWWLRRPVQRIPKGLRILPSEPLLPGLNPEQPTLLRSENAAELLREMLGKLATRRVVIVGGPPVVAPAGLLVMQTQSEDRLEVEVAIQSLARIPGLPIVVLLMGPEVLKDPGAVAGHPAVKLADSLPAGTWIFALIGEEPGWGWAEWKRPVT